MSESIEDIPLPQDISYKNLALNDGESSSELRKRARKVREEKTAALVQNIKNKQKEIEQWQTKRSIIVKFSIAIVLIIAFVYFIYKNFLTH